MLRPTSNTGVNLADVAERVGAAEPEANPHVTGASMDNRAIEVGDLFIAMPGTRVHGAKFAGAAIAAGAVAVLTDAAGRELVDASVPVIVVEDVAWAAGPASAAIYGDPATKLTTFAVTGTNGKTTTSFMLDSILGELGRTTGLIGTVATRLAGAEVPAHLTTPQPADLQAMLATLVERGGTDLVMEVSSHALAQGRSRPIQFSVAGFTNLTQDHLDFHNTLEEYYQAKRLLFTPENSQRCVIIVDDDAGARLFDEVASERPGAAVALAVTGELGDLPAGTRGWHVTDVHSAEHATRFTLRSSDGQVLDTATSLPGDFNVSNAALALVMALEAGHSPQSLSSALGATGVSPAVPGRMEVLAHEPRVIVDFAHNADALEKAIAALRPTTRGRLIVITGSAGDRDKTKRPVMARIVAEKADLLVVTDDDPHGEDPAAIRADLIAGIPQGAQWREIGDRTQAITETILGADAADTVLVAGRGHETIQEVAGVEIELDDRVVARAALTTRKNRGEE